MCFYLVWGSGMWFTWNEVLMSHIFASCGLIVVYVDSLNRSHHVIFQLGQFRARQRWSPRTWHWSGYCTGQLGWLDADSFLFLHFFFNIEFHPFYFWTITRYGDIWWKWTLSWSPQYPPWDIKCIKQSNRYHFPIEGSFLLNDTTVVTIGLFVTIIVWSFWFNNTSYKRGSIRKYLAFIIFSIFSIFVCSIQCIQCNNEIFR